LDKNSVSRSYLDKKQGWKTIGREDFAKRYNCDLIYSKDVDFKLFKEGKHMTNYIQNFQIIDHKDKFKTMLEKYDTL
jgi:hypothetical protein